MWCNLATSGNSSLSSQCPDPTDAEFPTHQEDRRAKQLLRLPSLVSPLRPQPRLGPRSYRECIRPTSPVLPTQARISPQPRAGHIPHIVAGSPPPLCRSLLYGESRFRPVTSLLGLPGPSGAEPLNRMSAVMGRSASAVSSTAATCHMWPLGTCHGAGASETLDFFLFCFILINLNLSVCGLMQLIMASVLDRAAQMISARNLGQKGIN